MQRPLTSEDIVYQVGCLPFAILPWIVIAVLFVRGDFLDAIIGILALIFILPLAPSIIKSWIDAAAQRRKDEDGKS